MTSSRDVDTGWAWPVLMASFFCLLTCSGLSSIAGIFQIKFLEEFQGSVALTSWVTALFASLMQLGGFMASFVANTTNCRVAVMMGGVLMSLGFALSGLVNSLEMLLVTFGVIAGSGLGLVYTSSILSVSYFFQRRRNLALGVALSASGLGCFLMPQMSQFLSDMFSWRESIVILGGASAHLCVAGAIMFPIHEHKLTRSGCCWHRLTQLFSRHFRAASQAEDRGMSHVCCGDEEEAPGQNRVLLDKGPHKSVLDQTRTGETTAEQMSPLLSSPEYRRNGEVMEHCKLEQKEITHVVVDSVKDGEQSCSSNTLSRSHDCSQQYMDKLENSSVLLGADAEGERAAAGGDSLDYKAELFMFGENDTSLRGEIITHDIILSNETSSTQKNCTRKPRTDTNFLKSDDGSGLKRTELEENAPVLNEKQTDLLITAACPSLKHEETDWYSSSVSLHTSSHCVVADYQGLGPERWSLRDKEEASLPTSSQLKTSWLSLSPPVVSLSSTALNHSPSQSVHASRAELSEPLYRNLAFYILLVSLMLSNMACGIFLTHLPSFLLSQGLSSHQIANVFSLNGLALFVGRFSVGAFANNVKGYELNIFWALHVLGGICMCVIPLSSTSVLGAILTVYFKGTYYGSTYALLTPVTLLYVDMSQLATALGIQMVCAGLGYLVFPPFAGFLVDMTGSYEYVMFCGGAMLIVSGLILFLLPVLSPGHTNRNEEKMKVELEVCLEQE